MIDQISTASSQADAGSFFIGVVAICLMADLFAASRVFRTLVLLTFTLAVATAVADKAAANVALKTWQQLFATGLMPGITLGLPLRVIWRRALGQGKRP